MASRRKFVSNEMRGAALLNVPVEIAAEELKQKVFNICNEFPYYEKLSAVECGLWPIILIGCRYYRYPLPIDLFKTMFTS